MIIDQILGMSVHGFNHPMLNEVPDLPEINPLLLPTTPDSPEYSSTFAPAPQFEKWLFIGKNGLLKFLLPYKETLRVTVMCFALNTHIRDRQNLSIYKNL